MEKFKVYKDNTLLGEFTKEEIELAKKNGAEFSEDIDDQAAIIYLLKAGEILTPGSQTSGDQNPPAPKVPEVPEAPKAPEASTRDFTCFVTLKKYVIVNAADKREAFELVRKHDLGQYLEARDVRIDD